MGFTHARSRTLPWHQDGQNSDSLDGKDDSLDDVDAGCGLEVIPQGHTFGRLALADIPETPLIGRSNNNVSTAMHFVAVSPDFIFSAGADFINVAALDTLHSRCIIMCCIDTSKEWDLRMHTAKRHGMQELSVQHACGRCSRPSLVITASKRE